MSAFLVKKGDYLCSLALTHSQGMEYEKSKQFYIQAASWYKKAGATDKMNEAIMNARAEDEKLKNAPVIQQDDQQDDSL